jgi:hypothetical protein
LSRRVAASSSSVVASPSQATERPTVAPNPSSRESKIVSTLPDCASCWVVGHPRPGANRPPGAIRSAASRRAPTVANRYVSSGSPLTRSTARVCPRSGIVTGSAVASTWSVLLPSSWAARA